MSVIDESGVSSLISSAAISSSEIAISARRKAASKSETVILDISIFFWTLLAWAAI